MTDALMSLQMTDEDATAFLTRLTTAEFKILGDSGLVDSDVLKVGLASLESNVALLLAAGCSPMFGGTLRRLIHLIADTRTDFARFETLYQLGARENGYAQGVDPLALALEAMPDVAAKLWGGPDRDFNVPHVGALKLVLRRSVVLTDAELDALIATARTIDVERCIPQIATIFTAAEVSTIKAKLEESDLTADEFVTTIKENIDEMIAAMDADEATILHAKVMDATRLRWAREEAIDNLFFAALPGADPVSVPETRIVH